MSTTGFTMDSRSTARPGPARGEWLCALTAALATALCAAAQVDVRLERFGAGDAYRPGDWIGIQVTLTSQAPEPVQARVQWDVMDGNGDVASNTRSVVLNPNQPTTRWLYGRLPPAAQSSLLEGSDAITLVRVFEERDGRRVSELASLRMTPGSAALRPMPVEIDQDLLGIVGTGRLGLDGYEQVPPGMDRIPSMNVLTRMARNISPRDLPDRWEGLLPFQAILWSDAQPGALPLDSAEALKAWIRHGGHLVISLPESGNPWALGGGGSNPLSELLPTRAPRRIDAVEVRTLLPILSKERSLRNERATTPLQVFDPAKLDRGFEPLMTLPCPRTAEDELAPAEGSLDGAVIAVQRRYGHGRITVIGLDVDAMARRKLQAMDLPQTDVFWNRVLGRRGDAPSMLQYQDLDKAEPRRLVRQVASTFAIDGDLVASQIGLGGQAALGILGMLGLFGAYWALAIPVSWVVLGRMRLQRHAWLLFVGVAGCFVVLAWGAGRLLGDTSVRIRHFTILDWVARGPGEAPSEDARWARATSWFSVSLPGYGRVPVTLGEGRDERNLLSVWSPPPSGSGMRFPNPSRYDVPLDSPGAFEVPSRATASEFEVRWLGAPPATWGALPAADGPAPITATITPGDPPFAMLKGTLTHGLPAPLRDVRVIHVNPLRRQLPRLTETQPPTIMPSDLLPNHGRMVTVAGEWPAGTPLDVGRVLYPDGPLPANGGGAAGLDLNLLEAYYRPVATAPFGVAPFPSATTRMSRSLDMLTLYGMLEQPAYLMNPPRDPETARVLRTLGRQADLSVWLTRPCLIVMGVMEESPLPLPLNVAGQAPSSAGTTFLRVVIPLPLEPGYVPPSP